MLFGLMHKFGQMEGEEILPYSLGLKSKAKKWAVPTGLQVGVV